MNRRNLTLGLVAGAGLVGGLAWSLRRSHSVPTGVTAAPTPATGAVLAVEAAPAASAALASDLWSQRFDRPEGGELVMADLRGKPLLVNFWATWCPPCVREMPLLDQTAKAHAARGLQVVGLAIDGPTPVRDFLKKTPVSFPIGLAGFAGSELARTLGDASGGLPFTVLFNAQGEAVQHKLGETHADELKGWFSQLGI
ncbi:MAG: redoxin family protein [Leptothrix sp. (in: b-proteobacteria)]